MISMNSFYVSVYDSMEGKNGGTSTSLFQRNRNLSILEDSILNRIILYYIILVQLGTLA